METAPAKNLASVRLVRTPSGGIGQDDQAGCWLQDQEAISTL